MALVIVWAKTVAPPYVAAWRELKSGVDPTPISREISKSQILHQRDIPIVVIDRALEDESVPSVVIHNYRAGELAAEHLVSLEHKQSTCITGPLNIALCRERVKAPKQVLIDHNIEFKEDLRD